MTVRFLPALMLFAAMVFGANASAQQGMAHDTELPIEIAADALEVQQDKQIAVFSGNVDAQQGSIKLRADRIWVHYQGDAAEDAAKAISKIDAEGKVFFSSGTETAEGDQGTYNVDNGVITLTGEVVLTQGNNVIKGNRLVFDLTTGQSTMDGDNSGGDGRVRGLFVPRQNGGR
jgi:lipopolysaccharide export system protein LptA